MDTKYYEKLMKRLYPDIYKDKYFDGKTMSWRKKEGQKRIGIQTMGVICKGI